MVLSDFLFELGAGRLGGVRGRVTFRRLVVVGARFGVVVSGIRCVVVVLSVVGSVVVVVVVVILLVVDGVFSVVVVVVTGVRSVTLVGFLWIGSLSVVISGT